MIEIKRTDSGNKDFKRLISLLDNELHDRYGDLQNFYDTHNIIEENNNVVVAYYDEIAAACGCFKKFDPESVEIKRMFVHKDYRSKGISKFLLIELENWAMEKGFKKAVLETGTKQIEAIGLYQKSGYKRIDNYGQYAGIDSSVCMLKKFTVK
ncbi:MAG: GNAT family N-acetyltransferase [Ignavibacteriaceae bacterium]